MTDFSYLLSKIKDAPIINDPFDHIYIENFFDENDFKKIVQSDAINTHSYKSNEEMFQSLFNHGFKSIDFPGCINNVDDYCEWHLTKNSSKKMNTACESFGMTLRLMNPASHLLISLKNFLESSDFNQTIAAKLDIPMNQTYSDHGIQKYLDGYEISPHPDIRKKALTYMVNINPNPSSHLIDHHTQYCVFNNRFQYIEEFWRANTEYDRCWVPWDWTETKFIQNVNNSFLMFSPSNKTLHAIKASYDHLVGQRTQLYGNLWYENSPSLDVIEWEDLEITPSHDNQSLSTNNKKMSSFSAMKQKLKSKISGILPDRNYSNIRNKD